MSGLEPLAALGLACNTIQLIGNARETLRLVRQVYQNGALDPEISEKAIVMENIAGKVGSGVITVDKSKVKNQDKQILDLAEKCRIAARDLQEEVKFLNGHTSKSKLVATLKIAAKTTWRKRRLEKHDHQLGEAEKLLEAGLMAKIYERSIKTDSDLSTIDSNLRAFIVEYRAEKQNVVGSITKHTTSEIKESQKMILDQMDLTALRLEEAVHGHIQNAAKYTTYDHERRRAAEMLLQSLKYDRMNERRNNSRLQHHPDTFKWVFNDGSEHDEASANTDSDVSSSVQSFVELPSEGISWDSVCDWLRSTETVYWISGKAGSGKSTLVKFLTDQVKTRQHLDVWRPGTLILSHFFWSSGTELQKNIKGLLCSLVYQLLSSDADGMRWVIREYEGISMKEIETDWDENGLLRLFESTACRTDYPPARPIIIFLDGLDEVSPKDGVLRIMAVVDSLIQFGHRTGRIKVCLASRPEPLLKELLGQYSKLRLEDLNKDGLRKFASDKIVIPPGYQSGSFRPACESEHRSWSCSEYRLSDQQIFHVLLVDLLVDKAQGVFLWMSLTVLQVQKALYQKETPDDIETRIANLPHELADLYADMWNRINEDSEHLKGRAATYLQLMLACDRGDMKYPSLTPLVLMLATDPSIATEVTRRGPSAPVPFPKLEQACAWTHEDIVVRCAGLLQHAKPVNRYLDNYHEVTPWCSEHAKLLDYATAEPGYAFIHRTARDFLTDTIAGGEILSHGSLPGYLARIQLLEAYFATFQIFRRPIWHLGPTAFLTHPPESPKYHIDNLSELLECLFFPLQEAIDVPEAELMRMFRILESLFNGGYLFGSAPVPIRSLQFDRGVTLPASTAAYHMTVHRQHEFLVEAAYYATNFETLRLVVNLAEERSCDPATASEMLLYLCRACGATSDSYALTSLITSSSKVLLMGASPSIPLLHRMKVSQAPADAVIYGLSTAFGEMVLAICDGVSKGNVDESSYLEALGVLNDFVSRGADQQQAIRIAVSFGEERFHLELNWHYIHDNILFGWDSNGARSYNYTLIFSCPASALLALARRLWLGTLADKDVPPIFRASALGAEMCSLVAVVDIGKVHSTSTFLPRVLAAREVYPKSLIERAGSGMHHVLQFFLKRLEVIPNQNEENGRSASNTGGLSVGEVHVPAEVRAMTIEAFDDMRSLNILLKERLKELRESLDIETPVEEREWQLGHQYLPPFPDSAFEIGGGFREDYFDDIDDDSDTNIYYDTD